VQTVTEEEPTEAEVTKQPLTGQEKPVEAEAEAQPLTEEKQTEQSVEILPAAPPEAERVKTEVQLAEGEKLIYDKSFLSRLILSEEEVKDSYSALKNELLKSGFQSRICWRYESFRADKPLAAKLAIRAGGLCLFCALDPENYPQAEDISDKKTYKRTPLMCLVKSESGKKISKNLIADLAQKFQPESGGYEECDYAELLPFEEMQSLLERGLVKVKIYRKRPRVKRTKIQPVTEQKITLKTVEEIPQTAQKKSLKKRYKKGVKKVINLEAVYACFEEGESATFEEIVNRIFKGNKNITYIKVLGRGKADKILAVTANSFSRSAEKNILGAGGKIIRKNS
ncbi:MAG: uL15 family ribosomal protein, partial [Clostridia bacterium]|nr:uL15 family ribosomal protein [Clostridia bacterium]